MKKNLLAFFLLFTFVFQSATFAQTATKLNSPARKAAENITAAQLKDYLYYVASDEMEGRDTPSRGLDATAKFIALNLSRWVLNRRATTELSFKKSRSMFARPTRRKRAWKSAGKRSVTAEIFSPIRWRQTSPLRRWFSPAAAGLSKRKISML